LIYLSLMGVSISAPCADTNNRAHKLSSRSKTNRIFHLAENWPQFGYNFATTAF
jgi:hypothetical protein